jgi:chromosome segregation ATPase
MKIEDLKWIIMGIVGLVFGVGAGILSFKYRREIRSGVSAVRDNFRKRIEFVRTYDERLNEIKELSNKLGEQQAKQLVQIEKLKGKQNKIDNEQKEISQSIEKLEADNKKYIEEHGTPEEFNEWMDNIRKLQQATDQCRLIKERHNMVMNALSDPNNTYTPEQRAANIENIDAACEKAQKDFEEINAKCKAYTEKYNIKGRPRDKDRNIVQEEPGNFVVNVDELNSRKILEI